MDTQSMVAMVIIDMDPAKIDVSTAGGAAALRKAVLDNLSNVRRVVAVMTEEDARLMCGAHNEALRAIGRTIRRPPADYVPPTRD